MANFGFPTFPYGGGPPIAPMWGGPPPFGNPGMVFDGPPPDPRPPNGEYVGMLTNSKRNQVADVRVVLGVSLVGTALAPNWKSSPIPDTQTWAISPVPGGGDGEVYIKCMYSPGPSNIRFYAAPSNNNSGVIELSMFEYKWTINPMNTDPNGGDNGIIGQTMTISTRALGVDRYWTLDETRGQIILGGWDASQLDTQVWTLQG
ncbi:hypothetical protein FB451DRAFT_1285754 [Mycena latifolia]|nr:hypothetical protein FB451DRAFT_1285754 [Mycena latifolia]